MDIILGHPWLSQHSPEVRWDSSEILRWSDTCSLYCLSNIPVHLVKVPSHQVNLTLMECGIVPLTCCLQLHSPRVVCTCCPSRSARPWRTTSRRLSNNSSYALPNHLPPPASSLWLKKDGGLRPCIDYRTINSQTVMLPYPFPLVPAALEELCGACIFTKLDLQNAYNFR